MTSAAGGGPLEKSMGASERAGPTLVHATNIMMGHLSCSLDSESHAAVRLGVWITIFTPGQSPGSVAESRDLRAAPGQNQVISMTAAMSSGCKRQVWFQRPKHQRFQTQKRLTVSA